MCHSTGNSHSLIFRVQYLLLYFITIFSFSVFSVDCPDKERYRLLARFHVLCSRCLLGSVIKHSSLGLDLLQENQNQKKTPKQSLLLFTIGVKERNHLWQASKIPLENFCSYSLFLSRMLCQESGGNNLNNTLLAASGEWRNEKWAFGVEECWDQPHQLINPKLKLLIVKWRCGRPDKAPDKGTNKCHYWQLV